MATTLQTVENMDWPQIMETHRGWLAAVVYARVRDSHAVEEVLQETALAASRHEKLADSAEGICKWLYRVAIRQAMLYRRRTVRAGKRDRTSIERNASANRDRSDAGNPFRILIASENVEQVQIALSQLGKKDYEILMLKYREGWSCRNMAERLGVGESALKSRLLRARNNLRQQLLTLDENWGQ